MKVLHRFKTYKGDPYTVVLQRSISREGAPCYGLCDPPDDQEAFLRLSQGMSDKQLLQTVIHEMAHAFFFDKCETNVTRYAKATVTLLHRLNLLPKSNAKLRRHSSKARTSR